MSNVKKIVIEVGGVELSLSPEDAKTLRNALNELYPPKEKIQFVPSPYPVYPARPYYWHEYQSSFRLASTTSASGTTTPLNLCKSSIRMLGE